MAKQGRNPIPAAILKVLMQRGWKQKRGAFLLEHPPFEKIQLTKNSADCQYPTTNA